MAFIIILRNIYFFIKYRGRKNHVEHNKSMLYNVVCVVILTEIIALELQYFAKMKLNMFFSSAKDENEVALCIKDLNAPGFYPSILSGSLINLRGKTWRASWSCSGWLWWWNC